MVVEDVIVDDGHDNAVVDNGHGNAVVDNGHGNDVIDNGLCPIIHLGDPPPQI